MSWPEDFIDKIICGDNLGILSQIPDGKINMCMTSPPYWGLRDYGVDGQYGLEKTPEEYIDKMVVAFSEVKRVMRKNGTLWLNVGDSYLNKCLCMVPERLAWSLIQDGWILRNKIIWYKPRGMPSSAKDRFTNKWEHIFLFSRSQKYYFDLDAVREETIWGGKQWGEVGKKFKDGGLVSDHEFKDHPLGKNPGDVFIIPTCPFPEAHFAVFPEKLCEKPIKAGCPEGGIVLDPFCGVGTVLLVATHLKRHYVGIDIKREFCRMSEKRIAKGIL